MLKLVKSIVIGLVLAILGMIGLGVCVTASDEISPGALSDYDYLQEICELETAGRLGEAEHLADWVLGGSSITNRDVVAAVRERINRNRTSLWSRAKRAVKGFVVGDGTSIEELGGAVVSDFLLWGDVRDLAKQGYNKVTGKETDPVVAALAAVGVVTSVASYWPADPAESAEVTADASLSFLKALRKMGHLSNKFCGVIVDASKASVKAKSVSKGLKELVVGTKSLFEGVGAARATTIMKHIDDIDSLTAVSKMAKHAAEPTMIVVRMHGAEGVKMLGKLVDVENGAFVVEKAARKGAPGLKRLKKVLSEVKYGARAGKSLRHGNVQKFLKKIVLAIGRIPVAIVSIFLLLAGLWQMKLWGFVRFCSSVDRQLRERRC